MWLTGRRGVRKVAVGVETTNGSTSFRFSKHDKIVTVQFEPQGCVREIRFIKVIQKEIYETGTGNVQPKI